MPIASLTLCLALASSPAGESVRPVDGSKVADVEVVDARYGRRTLSEIGPARAVVLFFTSVGCPIAERALPVLGEMEKRRRAEGVRVLAVNVGFGDTIVEAAAQGVAAGIEFPCVRDFDGVAAAALGVTRSGEAVVLDGEFRLVYRGRVDGRFRLGGASPNPGREDLERAIDDVLAGRPVEVPETAADGCPIVRPADLRHRDDSAPRPEWEFSRDVAPIVERHCRDCHRRGGDAPFPLETGEEVARRSRAVGEAVRSGLMPPWHAAPAPSKEPEFVNRRGLSAAERRTVLDWVAAGAPGTGVLGTGAPGSDAPARDAAAPPEAGERGWRIGEPDLVVSVAEEVVVPAAGKVPYRYVLLPHVFPEDTWIERIQIRPSNPRVVHHANLGYVNLASRFDMNENFITGLVPGGVPMTLDAGTAVRIPKGSALGLEIHYVPTGKEERDRISVGLVFPRVPVEKRLRHMTLYTTRFEIPPGAPAHPVGAADTLDADATGVGLFSHMHWRGRDVTFRATPPGGSAETLLVVPNYSFDWQVAYLWPRGAKRFAKGTRVECRARFDNSAWNAFNPDPTRAVRFGLQTEDEMMYGFLFYTEDAERLGLAIDPETGSASPSSTAAGVTSPR